MKSPNAELGLEIKRFTADPEADPTEEIFYVAKLLEATYDKDTDTMDGGLWDEMSADGVPYEECMHVGNTAMAHYGVSPEFGELWWETRLGKEHLPILPEAVEKWVKSKQEAEKPKTRSRKKKTSS
ncbi:hypothetical protein QP966_07540 [Corynebacterium accolens]|nr:hypothetical protein [Corynebacterium accolens]MDK8469821.1 hypothetical protein [Corynebacterium accolens]